MMMKKINWELLSAWHQLKNFDVECADKVYL